jgi:release factor glutamine methyltransferase
MKTIKEVLTLSKQYLEKGGVVNARFSSESIIAEVLGIKRLEIYLDFERPLTNSELEKIKEFLKRRRAKEPLDYIFGRVSFLNCNLSITRDVLIPRPETEELAEWVIRYLKNDVESGKKRVLWDLGTGSGCLAISIKKELPDLDICASDISGEALEVAKKNAKKNGCEVHFLQGDLLDPFQGKRADYFICNPPYISEKEFATLMPEVKEFEPKIALVAKEEGLYFYKKLAYLLPNFLSPKAKVFFEMGYAQKDFLYEIFSDKRWISKKVYRDFAGKDRFFFLEIE